MTAADTFVCRNCGRPREGSPDPAGWCAPCRRVLVARTLLPAGVTTVLFVVLLLTLLGWMGAFESRFMVAWTALAALLSLAVWKVSRRVAFEVMRARGSIEPKE